MLYLYDKAIENKFKKLFQNTIYAPTTEFFNRYQKVNGNKGVDLPALSIWREGFTFNPYNSRTTLTVPNYEIQDKEDRLKAKLIYSLEVSLKYNLDIWTQSDVDRDDMLSELLYALTLKPNFDLEYEGELFQFSLLWEQPNDTNDISQFDSTGDLYRMTIPLIVNKARFFYNKDVKKAKYVTFDLKLIDKNN